MYFREDFSAGLEGIFPGGVKENVLSFAPLSKNNEWSFVVVRMRPRTCC